MNAHERNKRDQRLGRQLGVLSIEIMPTLRRGEEPVSVDAAIGLLQQSKTADRREHLSRLVIACLWELAK